MCRAWCRSLLLCGGVVAYWFGVVVFGYRPWLWFVGFVYSCFGLLCVKLDCTTRQVCCVWLLLVGFAMVVCVRLVTCGLVNLGYVAELLCDRWVWFIWFGSCLVGWGCVLMLVMVGLMVFGCAGDSCCGVLYAWVSGWWLGFILIGGCCGLQWMCL